MGIAGLASLVAANPQLTEGFQLQNTKLIIDGDNFGSRLYNRFASSNGGHNCCSIFGGDYHGYGRAIKRFFEVLRKCNVDPIVVLDGAGLSVAGKDSTVGRRFEASTFKMIRTMKNFDEIDDEKFAPFHMAYNLIEVLKEMRVNHFMVLSDADGVVAALARHFKCPVLSDDSDFFVFNLPRKAGCLSFRELDYKDRPRDLKCNQFGHYIEGRIFGRANFLKIIGLKAGHLPFLSLLMGNNLRHPVCPVDPFRSAIVDTINKPAGNLVVNHPINEDCVKLLLWLRCRSIEVAEKGISKLTSKVMPPDQLGKLLSQTKSFYRNRYRDTIDTCLLNHIRGEICSAHGDFEVDGKPIDEQLILDFMDSKYSRNVLNMVTCGVIRARASSWRSIPAMSIFGLCQTHKHNSRTA